MGNIGFKEDLSKEFKSDVKKISDDVIIECVVAFANTDGGVLYLGVEDDGEVTGVHKNHMDITQLAAYIANKTVPPVSTQIDILNFEDIKYITVTVPKCRSIVASSSGKILRRRLKMDNTPENIPMYPHEITTRLSDLSMLDFSSLPVPESKYTDLDSMERERLRNIIRDNHGETTLLELNDEELDKALCFAKEFNGELVPTYCGMIMIGKKERIKTLVPTVEAAFQEMKGTSTVVNDTFRLPLLASVEKIEAYMMARNSEIEMENGLYRISIPDFNKRAFREAVVNAFCHRDYTMLGTVRVILNEDGLTISNPGGFIEGVTIDNLLTAEPRGRNQILSDALKRIGLAERTGRGIDRIFEGSLLYGKPLPDYSESNSQTVKLFIPRSLPDKSFIKLISDEQNRIGRALPINALLVLNVLKENRQMNIKELSEAIKTTEVKTKATVENLIESGIIETKGAGKGRYYFLGAKVYKNADKMKEYVRRTGIDRVRYPEMICQFAAKNKGIVKRADVIELCHISENQAYRVLKKLVEENRLERIGMGKYTHYKLKSE